MDALLLVKASLLLAGTLAAERLLRRAPAGTRHRLWTVVFAAVLALPLLSSALPALYVPAPAGWHIIPPAGETAATPPDVPIARAGRASLPPALQPRPATTHPSGGPFESAFVPPGVRPSSWPPESRQAGNRQTAATTRAWPAATTWLLAVWMAGTAAAMGALLLSLVRASCLAASADVVDDPVWRHAAEVIGVRLGLRRPVRLVTSARVGTPMAGGLVRPVIFLPVSARTWSAERRDVVLAHEIAHLAGRDPLHQVVARLALACYWFHPLAWIAARHGAMAREQACDEAVVALGTRPSVYARVLLELADSMGPPAPALAALPMVQRSLLENRLMAILNDDVRPATKRLVLMTASGLALLTLTLAAAHPASSATSPQRAARATPAPAPTEPVEVAPWLAAHAASSTTAPQREARAAAAPEPVEAVPSSAAPEPIPPSEIAPQGAAQDGVSRDSACWRDADDDRSFRGASSSRSENGRMVFEQQIGTRGTSRVIQRSFDGLRLCMIAEGVGDSGAAGGPSNWIGRASRVVVESRLGGKVQRMELGRPAAGGGPASWLVGGVPRPLDRAAEQWRDGMLALLDTTWEIATLRGEVSSLRGQISSLHGERSSLQGEISSLQGEISSMRGRASSIRGQESSLRGRISSIQGHVSSLQGAISSEQGAISSLNAGRYGGDDRDRARVAQHEAAIKRVEQEIRDYGAEARIAAVEREITALNPDGKVAGVEAEIRAFNLDAKVADIERRIVALDIDGHVAAIERRIAALDADRRTREMEKRQEDELKRLEAAIGAIR